MSWPAIRWAREQQGVSQGAKHVLLVLATHTDDDHCCWPGRRLLAAECSSTTRSVSRYLAELESAELIVRERRERANGSRASDYIHLQLDDDLAHTPVTDWHLADEQGATATPPPGQPDPTQVTETTDLGDSRGESRKPFEYPEEEPEESSSSETLDPPDADVVVDLEDHKRADEHAKARAAAHTAFREAHPHLNGVALVKAFEAAWAAEQNDSTERAVA